MVLRIKFVLLQVPSRLFWFAPVILLLLLKWKSRNITKHLMPGPSGKQLVLFSPEFWCFPRRTGLSGKQYCFPRDLTLSVYYRLHLFLLIMSHVVFVRECIHITSLLGHCSPPLEVLLFKWQCIAARTECLTAGCCSACAKPWYKNAYVNHFSKLYFLGLFPPLKVLLFMSQLILSS